MIGLEKLDNWSKFFAKPEPFKSKKPPNYRCCLARNFSNPKSSSGPEFEHLATLPQCRVKMALKENCSRNSISFTMSNNVAVPIAGRRNLLQTCTSVAPAAKVRFPPVMLFVAFTINRKRPLVLRGPRSGKSAQQTSMLIGGTSDMWTTLVRTN